MTHNEMQFTLESVLIHLRNVSASANLDGTDRNRLDTAKLRLIKVINELATSPEPTTTDAFPFYETLCQ
jgi:hypothetical protein